MTQNAPAVDVDALACRLYTDSTRSAPTWRQLGHGTREVWREKARRYAAGDTRWWSITPAPTPAVESQAELF
jgi:hypothetical protein